MLRPVCDLRLVINYLLVVGKLGNVFNCLLVDASGYIFVHYLNYIDWYSSWVYRECLEYVIGNNRRGCVNINFRRAHGPAEY